MEKRLCAFLVSLMTFGVVWMTSAAWAAEELGGQVFFRGGASILTREDRGDEVFTDTRGAAGRLNDSNTGLSIGAGFNLPLFKDPLIDSRNTVLAEILLDYAQFSRERVVQTTSAVLGAPRISEVTVNALAISAAPKYRFELGRLRPWIIPIGLGIRTISPPNNNTEHLSVGLHFAGGIEYRIIQPISIGLDVRYNQNLSAQQPVNWISTGMYIGFNF